MAVRQGRQTSNASLTLKDRTTAQVIMALGDDVQRCHSELIAALDAGKKHPDGTVEADYEYHARQLVRSIFAFIEAVTFSMKVKAAAFCLRNKSNALTPAERYLAGEVEHTLSDKGLVVERPAHIRFSDNIRFAFALQEKAHALSVKFDPSVEWWSCLKKSIRVRDRLTHPKAPGDINVSGEEIVSALRAFDGFSAQAASYPSLRKPRQTSRAGRAAARPADAAIMIGKDGDSRANPASNKRIQPTRPNVRLRGARARARD